VQFKLKKNDPRDKHEPQLSLVLRRAEVVLKALEVRMQRNGLYGQVDWKSMA
jgi:hypothetical protein